MTKLLVAIGALVFSGVAIYGGTRPTTAIATDSNNVDSGSDAATPAATLPGVGTVSHVTPQPPPTPATVAPPTPKPKKPKHDKTPPTTGVHKNASVKLMAQNL